MSELMITFGRGSLIGENLGLYYLAAIIAIFALPLADGPRIQVSELSGGGRITWDLTGGPYQTAAVAALTV